MRQERIRRRGIEEIKEEIRLRLEGERRGIWVMRMTQKREEGEKSRSKRGLEKKKKREQGSEERREWIRV